MMNPETHCRHLITEAITLTEKIFTALSEGDSELADTYAKERHHTLESIPFQELGEELPKDLLFAFNHLLTLNEQLIDTSKEAQDLIATELNKIKKGISSTQAYQDINHST